MPDLWNSSFESKYSGTSVVSLVDDIIKELKEYVRKCLAVIVTDTSDTAVGSGADVDNMQVKDGSIDTDQLAADAVTGAKIGDDEVDSEHYAADSIDTEHVNWGSGAGQIDLDEVPDGTTYEKIAGTQLSSGKLATGAEFASSVSRWVNVPFYRDGASLTYLDFSTDDQYVNLWLPDNVTLDRIKVQWYEDSGGSNRCDLMRVTFGTATQAPLGTSVANFAASRYTHTETVSVTIDASTYFYRLKFSAVSGASNRVNGISIRYSRSVIAY